MALVQVNFFSKTLLRTITINAIVPVDKMFLTTKGEQPKEFKTLYLLHGVFGNYTDWISGTRLQRWAQDQNLCVIMPSGENKFYVNNEATCDCFMDFISEELVDVTRRLFPLSPKREDTFIGGLSMGGYGALINGLNHTETFGSIICLSAGLILDLIYNSTNDKNTLPVFRRKFFEATFGPIEQLPGSEKDYNALITNLVKSNKEIPNIFMACGTEDSLIEANREFHDLLTQLNVNHTYVEGPGNHNWDFWDEYIYKAMQWLPLNPKEEGLSSGHVITNE